MQCKSNRKTGKNAMACFHPRPNKWRVASLPAVHLQAAGLQQALLQHLHQDLHVCALPAGFLAVAALETAVHRLYQAATLCICEFSGQSKQ